MRVVSRVRLFPVVIRDSERENAHRAMPIELGRRRPVSWRGATGEDAPRFPATKTTKLKLCVSLGVCTCACRCSHLAKCVSSSVPASSLCKHGSTILQLLSLLLLSCFFFYKASVPVDDTTHSNDLALIRRDFVASCAVNIRSRKPESHAFGWSPPGCGSFPAAFQFQGTWCSSVIVCY